MLGVSELAWLKIPHWNLCSSQPLLSYKMLSDLHPAPYYRLRLYFVILVRTSHRGVGNLTWWLVPLNNPFQCQRSEYQTYPLNITVTLPAHGESCQIHPHKEIQSQVETNVVVVNLVPRGCFPPIYHSISTAVSVYSVENSYWNSKHVNSEQGALVELWGQCHTS